MYVRACLCVRVCVYTCTCSTRRPLDSVAGDTGHDFDLLKNELRLTSNRRNRSHTRVQGKYGSSPRQELTN